MRASHKEATTLNRDVQTGIGKRLCAMYEGLTKEHIPSRHLDLLQRFERNEASKQVAVPQKVPSC